VLHACTVICMHAIRAEDRSLFPRLSKRHRRSTSAQSLPDCQQAAAASARLHCRLILTTPSCPPQTQQQGKGARGAADPPITPPCTRCSTPLHSTVGAGAAQVRRPYVVRCARATVTGRPLTSQQHHAASAWSYVAALQAGAGICAACNEPQRRNCAS